MINKVFLEGLVVRTVEGATSKTSDGATNSKGFFITVKQKRKVGSFELTDFFSLYGNDHIAEELRKVATEGSVISIEGILKTYRAKDGQYKTTIEVTKIVK